MGREIDEAFIEAAVERYQRLDARLAEFEKALAGVEVTVSSPDGLVEVVVTADGTIRDVQVSGPLAGRRTRSPVRPPGSGCPIPEPAPSAPPDPVSSAAWPASCTRSGPPRWVPGNARRPGTGPG